MNLDANAIVRAGRAGMWERAESLLMAAIKSSPSPDLLQRLAELRRQRGDLMGAKEAYSQLLTLKSDPQSAWWESLLSGQVGPAPSASGPSPVPFHVVDDFLPSSLRNNLWSIVEEQVGQVEQMPIYWQKKDGTTDAELNLKDRNQLGIRKPPGVEELISEKVRTFVDQLQPELGIPRDLIEKLQVSLVFSGEEQHSRIHRDDVVPGALTLVYYLSRLPKRYEGGELLLFDTDLEARSWESTRFTTIVPRDNRIVAFPSFGYHQVVSVRCQSRDLLDTRIAIPVHVRPYARS